MMDDNGAGPVLIILALGGLVLWWLKTQRAPAATPPLTTKSAPPCSAGISYAGVGVSGTCGAIGKVVDTATHILSSAGEGFRAVTPATIPLIGGLFAPSMATPQQRAEFQKKAGVQSRSTGGWR